MAIAAMTTSHPEAHRAPPQSRPLLRVVENFRPAVDEDGRRAAPPAELPETAPPDGQLLATLASADSRVSALAARIATAHADLRLLHDELAAAESSLRRRSLLLRGALVLLLPTLATLAVATVMAFPLLTEIASLPYPPIAAGVAGVVAAVHGHVTGNRLLLSLFLPAASVVAVFAAALVLRMRWRRGLAVSDR
jgi:lipopolysaccharide export LptBFGC system permease protein LptF